MVNANFGTHTITAISAIAPTWTEELRAHQHVEQLCVAGVATKRN